MENDQIGKAKDTERGDWIEIRSRNPNAKKENDKIDNGFHYFDVVMAKTKTKQQNNPAVLLYFRGSIGGNTIVKKIGSNRQHNLGEEWK